MNFDKLEKHILLAIFLIGVIAKIASLLLLPQAAYNDALFHVFTAQQIVSTKGFEIGAVNGIGVPPPFFYSAIGPFFLLANISLNVFSAKIFGIILLFLQLVLAFVLFKKIFPKNFLPALAFFVIFPWVTRFTSTSYPESITIVFVLAATLFTVTLAKKKVVHFFDLLPLIFVIGAMSLSKLNGTILILAFIPIIIYLLWKKGLPKKTIMAFALLTIFLSGFWFGLNYIKFGQFDQHIGIDVYDFGEETGFSFSSIISNLNFYYLYFWDFPNASAFLEGSFLSSFSFSDASLLFFVLTLPIFIVLLFGVKSLLSKKNHLAALVLFSVFLAFVPVIQRVAYYRLIIPSVPFFALLFGFGFNGLKEKAKVVALISLIGFSAFSVAYTSGSAYYFNLTQKDNELLYQQISDLPDDSIILIEGNRTRDIEFIFGKKAVGASTTTLEFLNKNEQEFYNTLKQRGISHIAVMCKKDPFDQTVFESMTEKNLLEKIFQDRCSKLFKVN